MIRANVFSVLGLCVCAAASAGPLNPPAGPVAPTPGPEPRIAINETNTPGNADSLFKITQRGSYYLTGNVIGEAAKHGIEIAAAGVTVDLNGFELIGVPGSLDGVTVTVNGLNSISIHNGSVRNWGGDGVDLGTQNTLNSLFTQVRSSSNAGRGFSIGQGSVIRDCVSHNNSGTGIEINAASVAAQCSAYGNGDDGIDAGAGSTVVNCVAFSNNDDGIVASLGCTIRDCTVRFSGGDGIQASSQCLIIGNNCTFSGNDGGNGAGIRITGNDNRIEANHCTQADRGIDIDATGNLIIRNTCAGNTTNWDIVAGNSVAPIVSAVDNLSAITGNTYGGGLGSTDPNANFTF